MTNLLIEAQKLDSIVKDYETILKSRQIMFKVEDLNKITQSVLPLVEREMKEKNIELSFKTLRISSEICSKQTAFVALPYFI